VKKAEPVHHFAVVYIFGVEVSSKMVIIIKPAGIPWMKFDTKMAKIIFGCIFF
jgi:hypothetical protein